MTKEIEDEMDALAAQCELALNRYAERTGAPIFADAQQERVPKSTKKLKAVSDIALTKMAKSLKSSCAESSEHIAELGAKLAAKADGLKDLQRQQQALAQGVEQARQAHLASKRKSLYRDQGPETVINKAKVAFSKSSPSHLQSVSMGASKPNNLCRK